MLLYCLRYFQTATNKNAQLPVTAFFDKRRLLKSPKTANRSRPLTPAVMFGQVGLSRSSMEGDYTEKKVACILPMRLVASFKNNYLFLFVFLNICFCTTKYTFLRTLTACPFTGFGDVF